jgi:hypothetical protein
MFFNGRNPCLERINIPGTVQDINWSYRMLPEVETLKESTELVEAINRTRNSSDKIEKPVEEKKPQVYVCTDRGV